MEVFTVINSFRTVNNGTCLNAKLADVLDNTYVCTYCKGSHVKVYGNFTVICNDNSFAF